MPLAQLPDWKHPGPDEDGTQLLSSFAAELNKPSTGDAVVMNQPSIGGIDKSV